MATLTNDLVINGYKLGRRTGQQFTDPDGAYLQEGLSILNSILSEMSAAGQGVPYFSEFSFSMQSDKTRYTVGLADTNDIIRPKPVVVNFVSFEDGGVSYPVEVISKSTYTAVPRLVNQASRPSQVYIEPAAEYATLVFTQKPSSNYKVTVTSKDELEKLTKQTEIDKLPGHFVRFLEYALGKQISQLYGSDWPMISEQEYQRLRELVTTTDQFEIRPKRSALMKRPYSRYIGCNWHV